MKDGLLKNIDGYPVERELGSGSTGTVYLVRIPGRQRFAALKLLKERVEPGEILRFKREFGAIARSNHPGIIGVYSIGDFEGRPYFLMEYIKGTDFVSEIRRGVRPHAPLPINALPRMAAIGEKVLEALCYLHSRRIVHRDIKPANIIVTESGDVKLLDFGLVWNAGDAAGHSAGGGTPGYQAPEQILRQTPDPRSDLYSLGVCFYEVLCGIHPFGAYSDWQQLISRQLSGAMVLPSALHPELSPDWDHFIERMVAVPLSSRYQTSGQALMALRRIASLETRVTSEQLSKPWGLLHSIWIDPFRLLDEIMEWTESDAPKLLCIVGPPRSGRTRILDEIESRFPATHRIIRFDLSQERDSLPFLLRLYENIMKLTHEISPDSDADIAEDDFISAFLRSRYRSNDDSPRDVRRRFIDEYARIITHRSYPVPIGLLIDNLDLAGELVPPVLQAMAVQSSDRLMIIGTCSMRPPELSGGKVVDISCLNAQEHLADVSRFITSILGIPTISEATATRLIEFSGGLLGVVRDIMEAWLHDGSLTYFDEQWYLGSPAIEQHVLFGSPELSEYLKQAPSLIRSLPRDDRLDREILRTLAVFDHACPFGLLSGIFAAREELLLEVLDRLIKNNWIDEEVRDDEVYYRFHRREYQQQIYQTIAPFHRSYIHRRLADIIGRRKSCSELIDCLAYHFSRSDDPEAGLKYLENAADAAASRFDNTTALHQYERLKILLRLIRRNKTSVLPGPMDYAVRFDGQSCNNLYDAFRNSQVFLNKELELNWLYASMEVGRIHIRMGEYGHALEEFQRMLAVARDVSSLSHESYALRYIGTTFYYQKKWEDAERYIQDALDVRKRIGDMQGIGDCLNALGAIAQNQEKLDIAADYFNQAVEIKMNLNDLRGVAYLQNNLGNIHFLKQDYDKAIRHFNESYTLLKEMKDQIGMAYCVHNIGGAYEALGCHSDAIKSLQEAVAIRTQIQDKGGIAEGLWSLGDVHCATGNYEMALQTLQSAADLFEELGRIEESKQCIEQIDSLKKKLNNFI